MRVRLRLLMTCLLIGLLGTSLGNRHVEALGRHRSYPHSRSLEKLSEELLRRHPSLFTALTRIQPNDVRAFSEPENENAEEQKGEILRTLFEEKSHTPARKRTCLVNLGGHCATENAASLAEQWNYLESPNSPGRRRKRHSIVAGVAGLDSRRPGRRGVR